MTLALHPDGRAIVCRVAQPSDQAYVARTWTMSMASTELLSTAVAAKLVDRVLNDAGTRVVIAADSDDANTIIGFLAFADLVRVRCIHYANVRARQRRQGVANAMLRFVKLNSDRPLVYTFDGPATKSLLTKFAATKVALEDVLR